MLTQRMVGNQRRLNVALLEPAHTKAQLDGAFVWNIFELQTTS